MKGIFLIVDGVADEGNVSLDWKTPLEAAKTPNLDEIAKKGRVDYCYPVKEGVIPQSSSAIISLFGYEPNEVSRGVLEAMGAGIELKRGDLALRCNFATIENIESLNLLDRRAGRTLTNKEARILAKAINEQVKLPFKFEFRSTNQHRGVLIFRGGFSDNISNIDPHYGIGVVRENNAGNVSFSKPLDDEEDSRLSAELVNNFVRKSHDVLKGHTLNFGRASKGLYIANFLLCRDAGNRKPAFKKLKGKWMALGYMPLGIGIARALKMDVFRFNYPKMKSIDVYENLNVGLKKSIRYTIKMIKKFKNKYDYFYVHIKETDVPGLDNKPFEKVKMIELLDRRLFSYLRSVVEKQKVKLVIASDHVTSSKRKKYVSGSVPVLFFDPENTRMNEHRFTEEDALKGRKISGRKLLERTLFLSRKTI
ncbi:MAG: hypothetical protein Q8P57_00660 [Candidatus Pacearchaeota archaeon]|nr:hypothetical protein [Candidatus Pacearchaeota archaeon]